MIFLSLFGGILVALALLLWFVTYEPQETVDVSEILRDFEKAKRRLEHFTTKNSDSSTSFHLSN